MNEVVGRAARGQQCHHGIDDAALVHQFSDGGEAFLAVRDGEHGAQGFARQFGAQFQARIDKSSAWHMQAHGFQQHLVAVGGAVEGAGSRRVVGR